MGKILFTFEITFFFFFFFFASLESEGHKISRAYDTKVKKQGGNGTQIQTKLEKKKLISLWQYSLLTICSGILYENFNYCATYEI